MNPTKTINRFLATMPYWLGIVMVSVPLAFQFLWQAAFRAGNNQAERVSIFMDYFGGVFSKTSTITGISLLFCMFAIFAFGWSLGRVSVIGKIINFIVLFLAAFLLLLNIFSLM
jgi:hypothetical protein